MAFEKEKWCAKKKKNEDIRNRKPKSPKRERKRDVKQKAGEKQGTTLKNKQQNVFQWGKIPSKNKPTQKKQNKKTNQKI